MVKAGYRVAICDQLEDPKLTKGIVKRGVTELVTPGVALNDKLLDNKTNNFLAALHLDEKQSGIAFLDISTGECFVAEGDEEYIDKLLQSFQPAEVVVSKTKQRYFKEQIDNKTYNYGLEDWIFQHHYAYELLTQHFQTQSLKGFGVEEWKAATIAAGAAFHYLKETEHPHIQHLTSLQRITANEFLWMDRFTIRNLELIHCANDEGYSLLTSLDQTLTPMGARLLRRWIIFPLSNINDINKRLSSVAALMEASIDRDDIQFHLKSIGDIERIVAKIPLKRINPRELLQLSRSLKHIHEIQAILSNNEVLQPLQAITQQIQACSNIQQLIDQTIHQEAPMLMSKGNVIQDGFDKELDEWRQLAYHGKDYLNAILEREVAATGIPSLKISFNNVFGYYLEVTNTHKDKVPETWIRKQTLANAERYITEELKTYEEKILNAEGQIAILEAKIYDELLTKLQTTIGAIQQNAQAIAQLDVLQAFANVSLQYKYVRPEVTEDYVLDIKAGRHPVIEQHLPAGEAYVANDIYLDKEKQQIIILTGPNMSGKSALLRQTAMITLLAHMGCFVPANSATIGLTDKIFTRVGASDNLSGGESTFMVEMNETATIINNLSERSLVLLDEIGRGTSTYDGISIAWSIVEFIHNGAAKAKTLFATHYHELNELEHKLAHVKNYHITHKEVGNKVIFLRKLAAGGSRHSFGIQVAKMAGMPNTLTDRANEILAILEAKHNEEDQKATFKKIQTETFQLNIFDGLSTDLERIKNILFATDINTLTPIEALMKLNELKEVVKQYQ